MSHFIKTGNWESKAKESKGELNLEFLISNVSPQLNLIAGANILITGSYPNLTISSTGGGGGGSIWGLITGVVTDQSDLITYLSTTYTPISRAITINGSTQDLANNRTWNVGTVTSFGAGVLSPLFTTSVATGGTTPALTFILSNAGANTWFGNNTGLSATPVYNSTGNLSEAISSILTIGGANTLLGNTTIQVAQANGSTNGYLSSTDWTTFNNKLSTSLPSGDIYIGSAGNVAVSQAMSGDASIVSTGVLTLATVNGNIGNFAAFTVNGKGLITAATNLSGDITSSGAVATLATVNSNVGSFGSATKSVTVTANGKGLITVISEQTITPAIGSITGLGTGVATALGINIGSAGAPILFNGVLGTPSSGVLTNVTGLPPITGIVGWPANISGALTNNGSGTLSWATYAPATFGSSVLYGNGSGGFSNAIIGSGLTFLAGTLSASGGGGTNNKQPWVGYIFQETWGGTLGNYTVLQPASTIGLSAGTLSLTGGANNFSNYIQRNYTTAATCYTISANIKPTADGNGIGLGILVSGTNTLTMEMDCNTAGARGTVYITLNGVRVATSSTVMSYTNSTDVLTFSLTRINNRWLGSVFNTTTGTTVNTPEFGQDFTVANSVALKMGKPFLYIKGGTFTCTTFDYFIKQKKGSALFTGDSITEGTYAGTENQAYVDQLRTLSLDPIELMAAGGTTSADWANTLYTEILNFAPSVIYMMIGMNDALASTSNATYTANLATLETNLTGYKIVYLYVTPHGNNATAEGFIAQYNTTLSGKTYHIDTHTPLYNATTGFCASSYIATDFIHPNGAGNTIIANTISQNSVATTDLPFTSIDKQPSYMTRGGSVFNFDRAVSLIALDKLYLTGTQLLFNTTTVNTVIHTNFSGSFTMAAGTNYAMMNWPSMVAIANAQQVYGYAARDNRSLGAFTDGGWYGIVAQTSGGTDIGRIGLTSAGTQVFEINANTQINTVGTASASGSVANLTYASSGGKNFYIRNTTAGGAIAYAMGNDGGTLGAYIQLNGSTASGNSGNNSLNIVSVSNSIGRIGFWKSGATPMMELTNTFGGSLSIGASLSTYNLSVTQAVQAASLPKIFALIAGAHTTITASTENIECLFDFSAAAGYATGAITTLRTARFLSRTYNFVGASVVTTSAAFSISGATIAGNNSTITTSIGLNIEGGTITSGTGVVTTGYGAYFNATVGAGTNYALGANGNFNLTGNLLVSKIFSGGTTTPTALLHLAAGSTSISPIRFSSGALTTGGNIFAGNVEFLTDKFYGTITTGTAQKEFTLNDSALTSGSIPIATTNGRLQDSGFTTSTLTSSTYTPTATNVTNITASTPKVTSYDRIGNIVTVYGSITVTNTLAVASEVDVSLPVASNLGAATDLNGIATMDSTASVNLYVSGDATNDRASIFFTSAGVGQTSTIYYSFQYKVI